MLFAICFFGLLMDTFWEIHSDFCESLLLWYEICEYQYGDFLLKQTSLVWSSLLILYFLIFSCLLFVVCCLDFTNGIWTPFVWCFFGFCNTSVLFFFLSWVFECYIFDLDKIDAEWGIYAIFLPNKIFLTEYTLFWGGFFVGCFLMFFPKLRFFFFYRFCCYLLFFLFLLALVNFSFLTWDLWGVFVFVSETLVFSRNFLLMLKKKTI